MSAVIDLLKDIAGGKDHRFAMTFIGWVIVADVAFFAVGCDEELRHC